MLQQIKPKTARAARALKQREPQTSENPKSTLFLHYTKCSNPIQSVMADLYSLKRPLALKFNKKNEIHPFEDAASFEFFSEKNDTSLIVFGSHSKKRPHALTIARTFDHKILDMIELLMDAESLRTLSQFKNKRKALVGLKPLISFQGSLFESPTPNEYTLAKQILLDFFKGPDVSSVDVAGLQYIISISVGEETVGEGKAKLYLRSYLIQTRRSGHRLPRVELEEMGPRVDFRIGRAQQADDAMMKEAMKTPKTTTPKTKKNIETDLIGDKVGRIHMGKQDLSRLQTRKMKGLKRGLDEVDDLNDTAMANGDDAPEGDAKRLRS